MWSTITFKIIRDIKNFVKIKPKLSNFERNYSHLVILKEKNADHTLEMAGLGLFKDPSLKKNIAKIRLTNAASYIKIKDDF